MPTDSGLHTIGRLPGHISEIEAARAAEERGIVVSPIARFSIEPVDVNGLVLGFGGIKPPEIAAGVTALGQALESLHKPKRVVRGRR